jgi:hypothetical protein
VSQPANELVVVELFTSQSCGKCPRANALLGQMAENEDILALAYGINYWDDFTGWSDPFAQPEFVARQDAYVEAGEARRKFTPHFVVNGSPELIRFRERRIRRTVSEAEALPAGISVDAAGEQIAISLNGDVRDAPALVWHVSYQAGPDETPVEGGPNRGKDMNHFNMVRAIETVGEWAGGEADFSFDRPEGELSSAVLIQAGPGGPILSAARIN